MLGAASSVVREGRNHRDPAAAQKLRRAVPSRSLSSVLRALCAPAPPSLARSSHDDGHSKQQTQTIATGGCAGQPVSSSSTQRRRRRARRGDVAAAAARLARLDCSSSACSPRAVFFVSVVFKCVVRRRTVEMVRDRDTDTDAEAAAARGCCVPWPLLIVCLCFFVRVGCELLSCLQGGSSIGGARAQHSASALSARPPSAARPIAAASLTLLLLFAFCVCFSFFEVKELLVSSISEPAEALQQVAATTSAEGGTSTAAAAAGPTTTTKTLEHETTSKEAAPLDRQKQARQRHQLYRSRPPAPASLC